MLGLSMDRYEYRVQNPSINGYVSCEIGIFIVEGTRVRRRRY